MENQIFNEDCLETMSRMSDSSIDLVVTSPPYDNLRSYDNDIDQTWGQDVWKPIISELCRVIKEGGVIVWVVGDATIDGSETGSSFKQALYFKECGLNLHDTMIWVKKGGGSIGSSYSYTQNMEYMFILSKGRPSTFNPIKDCLNLTKGRVYKNRRRATTPDKGRVNAEPHFFEVKSHSKRNNWWYIPPQNKRILNSFHHPATFPESLAQDHIISWSNKGEIVYDPFLGSGTTAKVAKQNKRKYIGSEINEEYFKMSKVRLDNTQEYLF